MSDVRGELPAFCNEDTVRAIQREFGTPVFVYDQRTLEQNARSVLAFPNASGLTARFAMKACPTAAVIRVLHDAGLHIDASSGYEVERAMRAGVPAEHIQLTAQQLPANLERLVQQGMLFNACSLEQLHAFGKLFPGRSLSIRVNPGLGSGHSQRTNVGGPSSSFGIWHAYLPDAVAAAQRHGVTIAGVHTHIGSGTDPEIWARAAELSFALCARLPEVTRLSLGGGFKVARVAGESTADLQVIGRRVMELQAAFEAQHRRKLQLEIEPGGYLVATAGALIGTVIDVVDTGADGYRFIKVDLGLTEIQRPAMYGSQHPIAVVPVPAEVRATDAFLVVGHCCESGDLLTPEVGDPEGLRPRELLEPRIGDALVLGAAGAYCAAMSAKNYNSFPEAAEIMIASDGTRKLIRRRQSLEQALQNEVL
jgi:diaminopimelate decarboxylase